MAGQLGVADMAIGVIIAVSALFGVMRGFVREVVSLVIWVAALVLGIAYGSAVGGLIVDSVGPRLTMAIGFVVVFVTVLVSGAITQRVLGGLVESTGLTGTDRTIGLLFGAARGVAVAIVALIVLRPFAAERDWWAEAHLITPLLALEGDVVELINYLFDGFGRAVGDDGSISPAEAVL